MRLINTTPITTIMASVVELMINSRPAPPTVPGDFQMGDFLSVDFKTEG